MKAENFIGMNNVTVKAKQTLEQPSMILNAMVDNDGSVQRRAGHELIVNLPGAHSLWTNNKGIELCAAHGNVYRVIGTEASLLAETGQPEAPFNYVEIGGMVYLSNAYWTGMYDPQQNAMKTWGTPLPAAPILIPVSGGLPPGEYWLSLTTKNEYGRTSGNSALSKIGLSEPGGIEIVNLPENASVWMTDPNGGILLFAGQGSVITETPGVQEPIPTMWGSPPLPMRSLSWAFGRVWGINGNKVYYSEPYQPELFCLSTSFFDMGEKGLIVAKAASGMFIGCESHAFYLSGTNPLEMVQVSVGPGVIPGTLCYANDLGELGRDVPIWVGKDGVYAGLADGRAVNIIKDRIQISPQQKQGASICRVKDGRRQMLFSMAHNRPNGQDVGFGDDASCEVIRKGTVI